jgi:hypothetical protein
MAEVLSNSTLGKSRRKLLNTSTTHHFHKLYIYNLIEVYSSVALLNLLVLISDFRTPAFANALRYFQPAATIFCRKLSINVWLEIVKI